MSREKQVWNEIIAGCIPNHLLSLEDRIDTLKASGEYTQQDIDNLIELHRRIEVLKVAGKGTPENIDRLCRMGTMFKESSM